MTDDGQNMEDVLEHTHAHSDGIPTDVRPTVSRHPLMLKAGDFGM